MIILTLRTDKPEAEIGLFDKHQELAYINWEAHRELSSTIHLKIRETLQAHGLTVEKLGGIVAFKGPGSFTGLRIGLSVANALSYSLTIPIVSSSGEDWIKTGIERLLKREDEKIALPDYGREPHITKQIH
ncbi:MAG TPA: tRNA (adenosine(37)-N6)-threonylcarbamoyltransferase complex dimerization subunit type 1 TsaB [Candidatus Saccharimonadales bacterium]|nr:tRNA (adenosine(37)-N6)-threonylcarbamoyltransferase complex dimerization subunit type 1 TsaB [Candidatus Saccharimonadales bacterium]